MFAKSATAAATLALAAAMVCLPLQAVADPSPPEATANTAVANFTLVDQSGVVHELYSLVEAPAIVIVTQVNGDPLSQEGIKAVEGFKAIFRQASYFALNSSPADTAAGIAAEASAIGAAIPILDDAQQAVARNLGVTQTGEAFIIDPVGWKVVYRGPVNATAAKDADAQYLLFNALVHVMGHRPLDQTQVAVKGAPIAIAAAP